MSRHDHRDENTAREATRAARRRLAARRLRRRRVPRRARRVLFASALCAAAGCSYSGSSSTTGGIGFGGASGTSASITARILDGDDSLRREGEHHLRDIRQLTFGGENAEGYFSFDGRRLTFQSTRDSFACDQIFSMRLDGGDLRLVSTGGGRTTCSYYLPGNREILFASTHHLDATCPPRPDYSRGYVWALYDFDIFVAPASGVAYRPGLGAGNATARRLTESPAYDAEATVAPDGSRIIWTSLRDGDLDLYSMKIDGTDVRRLTSEVGYDGGAFYSADAKRIVYRAHHPKTPEAIARYRELLAQKQIEPKTLEIMIADVDGGNARAITANGAANFAPYWHPDGRRVLFASNLDDPAGRDFDVFMIRDDGTGLEKVIADSTFDGFPVFSPDGKRLVFSSNRASKSRGETNLFIAEWAE